MNTNPRSIRTPLWLCGACLVFHAASAHEKFAKVRASTEQQIVNAMLAANQSGTPTLIRVAPGHYHFPSSFSSEIGSSGLPPVSTTIVIEGRDAEQTSFEPAPILEQVRAFTVLSTGRLVLRDVSVQGWQYVCGDSDNGCLIDHAGGAAVANFGGVLWIERCHLSGNRAAEGQGSNMVGGAIYTYGHFHLEDSEVTNNSSLLDAGGIAIISGTAHISRSVISRNTVDQGYFEAPTFYGGGILVGEDTKLWIDSSTVSGNGSARNFVEGAIVIGNGILNFGKIWMTDSAVIENTAFGGEDGATALAGRGGGIANSGTLVIKNSTIGGNSTGTFGGGIYNSGAVTLQGVTLVRNHITGTYNGTPWTGPMYPEGCDSIDAPQLCFSGGGGIWNDPPGTLHVLSSVIANNTESDCDGGPSKGNGALISEGHNALGSDHHCQLLSARASDQINVDPRLDELQENGEPGYAHYPLLAQSPLIDAGGRVFQHCSPRDQLGHRRVDGDHDGKVECDIGAIELGSKHHGGP